MILTAKDQISLTSDIVQYHRGTLFVRDDEIGVLDLVLINEFARYARGAKDNDKSQATSLLTVWCAFVFERATFLRKEADSEMTRPSVDREIAYL